MVLMWVLRKARSFLFPLWMDPLEHMQVAFHLHELLK